MAAGGSPRARIIVPAVAVLLGVAIGYGLGASQPAGVMTAPEGSVAAAPGGLEGEVTLGVLLPTTGDLSAHGEENLAGTRMGAEDFNAHLERVGAPWRMALAVEDTATNPTVALDKLAALNSRGIKVVVGPETSSAIRNIKGYSDSNGMVLLSCCSSAPTLAIPGDSAFRLVPDDSNQGHALARVIESRGVDALVTVNRGDAWGDGLSNSTYSSFASFGGTAPEPIRYNPEAPDYAATVSLLAERVAGARGDGAARVGVAMIGFAEAVHFMQSASEHDELKDTLWFGAGSTTKDPDIVGDPIAREFANAVEYTTVQVAVSNNAIYERVEERLSAEFGYVPSAFVHSSYDAPWIYGLAMLQLGSDDAGKIRDILPDVASRYYGAIGPAQLNDAGDLASANYEVWGVTGGSWERKGVYTHAADAVAWG